jgi:5-methylcytosine-specific restriction enzyme A
MAIGLFINGVYRGVLEQIREVQRAEPERKCYLQPYATKRIRFLAERHPTPDKPVTLYLSLTDTLGLVSYRAKVIEWEDKRELARNPAAYDLIDQHIKRFQPTEEGLGASSADGKQSVNLISVKDVERLEPPFAVSQLIKVSDDQPLRERTRSGSWSPVHELIDWLGTVPQVVRDLAQAQLDAEVLWSSKDTEAERQRRLATSPRFPERIQVVSLDFRRNPDVIVQILKRAKGVCEICSSPAPFLRASNGSPYLEVHHRTMLSEGGEDTVDNALAVCPNCHRRLHYGPVDSVTLTRAPE